MRRLPLLIAVGALWLFLAALPALADGGPHVASVNNGSGGLNADSCAGCHRAHTAQNDYLLVQASTVDLCLSCHGATATGSTVNVENGVQYALATSGSTVRDPSIILGALRDGGFETASIASGSGVRIAYLSGSNVRQLPKVPVLRDGSGVIAGQPVTSTHFDLNDPEALLTAWGNGPESATPNAGGTGNMDCATCHNPHGNGQYRILNTVPQLTGGSGFVTSTTPVAIDDAPLPPAGDTRNYTVIQAQTGGVNTTLLASQAAAYSNVAGDYFHRRVPWNATVSGTYTSDQPNGQAATFDAQINAWCTQCHSRYLSSGSADTTDAIFHNKHFTGRDVVCTTCHVAHGSNATMSGTYSANETYPGGAAAPVGDSRLLKVTNRGTCQSCHDPTGTIAAGTQVGPTPNPVVP